ncbi:MAG TPA: hypothetical protein VNA69_08675 [Thermoanaerobaculia bacterium]|nr:hypothetical protein [Thermoanaerobaculia bacterium]
MDKKHDPCVACRASTPKEGARVCPQCGHKFRGLAWEGIDAHWRSKHEDVTSYEEFWSGLCRPHRSGKAPIIAETEDELAREARTLARFISGKTVRQVWRHRSGELGLEFTDGTRLFVDHAENGLEFSIN